VEAGGEVEIAHQARRDEVLVAEVVVDAGAAVAAEVAGGELAFVGLDQVVAVGQREVLFGDDDAGEARAGPPLTAGAMAVAHRLRIFDLIRDTATQAGPGQRCSHDELPSIGVVVTRA
jgi:hypothetical protein